MFRFYSSPQDPERVTVVAKYSKGILEIAVARCSKKDSFIRRKGRMIAEGRLAKGKGKVYDRMYLDTCDISTFVTIAKQIATEVKATKIVY